MTTRALMDVSARERVLIGPEDAEVDEPLDALAAGARAFGELVLGQAVGVHPDSESGPIGGRIGYEGIVARL